MNKIIIAAPFGNYLHFPNTTRTLGTYTVLWRGGWIKRAWRLVRTVRYDRRSRSWVNRMALPSPGITSLQSGPDLQQSILSVHGFDESDWTALTDFAVGAKVEAIEYNLSCPNVGGSLLSDLRRSLETALPSTVKVIAKLPPVRWMDMGRPLYEAGVRHFHLCNTIPTPGGGMSGKPLMQYSLWAIDDFRQAFGDTVTLIGGGGVTCLEDVETYTRHGADHVSLGTMLFNPFNWRKVKTFY